MKLITETISPSKYWQQILAICKALLCILFTKCNNKIHSSTEMHLLMSNVEHPPQRLKNSSQLQQKNIKLTNFIVDLMMTTNKISTPNIQKLICTQIS